MSFWKQKLTSRKFWVAVASAAFIILSEGLGLNIDPELYWKVAALALGYIFGETAVDIARAKSRFFSIGWGVGLGNPGGRPSGFFIIKN